MLKKASKFLIYLILVNTYLYVYSKIIQNESELLEIISKKDTTIEINIDSLININTNIIINNSIEKISFIGNSIETSSIVFSDSSHQLYFNKNVKEIELKNLSIIGNIYFNNNENILVDSVSLSGNINSDFTIKNEKFIINNFIYNTTSFPSHNCIEIGGNVNIFNSTFRGSSYCDKRLMNYKGLDKYTLSISESLFSGEYSIPCLNIDYGLDIKISDSIFEKSYASESFENGSPISIYGSVTNIYNCTFRDNIGIKGGSFYLYNFNKFNANTLNIYNTTAIYKV
ncbi:hypothetical protein PIROE2DRAFT_7804 [Piromyces sp. E2]|nr:hypothetical protein PIROE2DRAFT_7804 [Piromyces sp. E2]|eukprot:OUM65257.1 hypothetical protein PIROE2DRAFT_7804 [Piromyces sp. E2]